jgi:hypothetical protein
MAKVNYQHVMAVDYFDKESTKITFFFHFFQRYRNKSLL